MARAVEAGETGVRNVPVTDGKMIYPILFDLQEAASTEANSIVKEWHKKIMLVVIDELWKEHLRELDQLRQSVQNASYEQKDPLVIYKVESFHMFERMLSNLNNRAVASLMRGQLYIPQPRPEQQQPQPQQQQQVDPEKAERKADPEFGRAMPRTRTGADYKTSRATLPSEEAAAAQRAAASAPRGQQQPATPVKAAPRVGRNDLCPCGSGKKYKNCHGRGL